MTHSADTPLDSTPPARAEEPAGPKRLGVLGTLVWNEIVDMEGRTEPVEEWGGVSYSLEALSVALPEGWVLSPLLKVGEDLAQPAFEYLRTIPRVEFRAGIQVVPFPHPRVELHYENQVRRIERLEGGVPPWSWENLEPLLEGVDALYVNFITGSELGMETARHFKECYSGPVYADLHSLFLGLSPQGYRFPQELRGWKAWCQAFDAVQMNEDEFQLLGKGGEDPWQLAAGAVGPGLALLSATLGHRGSAFVSAPGFSPHPEDWSANRGVRVSDGEARRGSVPLSAPSRSGDPTGCGDVWGATFFGRLLAGDPLEEAMDRANQNAARNVEYRGARGLHTFLGSQERLSDLNSGLFSLRDPVP